MPALPRRAFASSVPILSSRLSISVSTREMKTAAAGEEALQVSSIGLQRIEAKGDQPLDGVQVGTGGALAGRDLEVAGEVSQGQLAGGNQLTWRPLPAGIAGGA